MEIRQQVALAEHTTWLVGGPAEYFCLPTNVAEVEEALLWAEQNQKKVTVLSGGSNVLVSDEGIQGLVVCLKKMAGCETTEVQGRLQITALAGTAKSELLKIFLKKQLAPALFLAGIPGDVGGGVVMNAGVAEGFVPREFVEIVDWFEVTRIENKKCVTKRFAKTDVQWAYRHCEGWRPGIITRVGLSWSLEADKTILEQVKAANKSRLSKQPLDMPSCGSVFVNPPGHKVAQLIDSSGLKGYTVGGAQVSMKHANFIVNIGDATAKDMLAVIEHVKTVVKAQKNVELHTEVIVLR